MYDCLAFLQKPHCLTIENKTKNTLKYSFRSYSFSRTQRKSGRSHGTSQAVINHTRVNRNVVATMLRRIIVCKYLLSIRLYSKLLFQEG